MTSKDCSILINGHQLREALSFLAPDNTEEQLDQEVVISTGGAECHSGPGLYCWLDEYPEEGAIKLDGTSPAALSAPPAAGVPDGWKLVPMEPTPAMLAAFVEADGKAVKGYKAMLATAPTPPASEQQRAVVIPDEALTLLSRAQSEIESLAESVENLGEDLYEDDVSEEVLEARELAGEIGEYLRLKPHLARGEEV